MLHHCMELGGKMDRENIVDFRGKRLRRVVHEGEWYFVILDVLEILSGSKNPKGYLKDMKRRDVFLKEGWGQISTPLIVKTKGGKQRINCANKKGILRIIQSIPSKKAEPFKLWLAKVGSDRIDEIENPELLQKRAKKYYEFKGYPKDWIDKRIRGIAIRQDLTDEWKRRGIEENQEYAILTNEISRETFGVSVKEHKYLKKLDSGLENENLRDNMTDLELIFSMLGEASTTEIVRNRNLEGFSKNFVAAREGGRIAGDARRNLEKKSRRKVVSSKNNREIIGLGGKKINKKKETIKTNGKR
jgi:DNA-damage-inducible protein D